VSPFLAWLDILPFRVKGLFVFWPVVFLVGYAIYARAVRVGVPERKNWRDAFFWFWQRGSDGDADGDRWPPSHCPSCGGIAFHLSEAAAYCPACRREIVREDHAWPSDRGPA